MNHFFAQRTLKPFLFFGRKNAIKETGSTENKKRNTNGRLNHCIKVTFSEVHNHTLNKQNEKENSIVRKYMLK